MDSLLKQLQNWWPPDKGLVLAGGLICALLLLAVTLRRLWRRRRGTLAESNLLENLSEYPVPPPLMGKHRRVTLHGLPVRFRLIVAAPLGREAETMPLEDIDFLLDSIVPDLPNLAKADLPRIRVWPTQLSHQGFFAAFRRNTQVPYPESRTSRWVLMAGKVLFEGKPFGLGLALLADQVNTLGTIVVEHPHEWMAALRIVGHE